MNVDHFGYLISVNSKQSIKVSTLIILTVFFLALLQLRTFQNHVVRRMSFAVFYGAIIAVTFLISWPYTLVTSYSLAVIGMFSYSYSFHESVYIFQSVCS